MAGGVNVEALRERVAHLVELLSATSTKSNANVVVHLKYITPHVEAFAQNLVAFISKTHDKQVVHGADLGCGDFLFGVGLFL